MLLINVLFAISPIFGFLPQIYKQRIIYKPYLSLLNIYIALIHIIDYIHKKYNKILLYQNVVAIILHMYLISLSTNKNYRMTGIIKSIGLVTLGLIILGKSGFYILFPQCALLLDVAATYIHYNIYKHDPKRPFELFVVWMIGDFIRVYFYTAVYKAPFLYICAVIIQTIFNILTVLMPSQAKIYSMNISYDEY